jgi:hypothetical protein
MRPNVDTLVSGALTIAASAASPTTLRLDWTGRSVEQNPGDALRPYFDAILSTASEIGCGLELHFEQLEFFNSSTVTAVIQLIRTARGQGTSLLIVFDESRKWQVLSFDALKSFQLPDGLLRILPSADAS